MATQAPQANQLLLARQAREHFVGVLGGLMQELTTEVAAKLKSLENRPGTTPDKKMALREASWAFQKQQFIWTMGVRSALEKAVAPAAPKPAPARKPELGMLALVEHDVIENQVLAARLSDAIKEKSEWEFNQLKARIHHLEGGSELHAQDVFRPEVIANILLEQWAAAEMSRDFWKMVQDAIQRVLVAYSLKTYKATNQFLIEAGVLPDVAYRAPVKREEPKPQPSSDFRASQSFPQRAAGGWQESRSFSPGQGAGRADFSRSVLPSGGDAGDIANAVSRLNQVRIEAENVVGQLQLLLRSHVNEYESSRTAPLTQALKQAMAVAGNLSPQFRGSGATTGEKTTVADYGPTGVIKAAGEMRQRSQDLKKKAGSQSEKAIIEVVALMFDSILAEERLPSGVRVWFSRLQMPVLREALADPVFFETLDHPARKLIDSMGSCVMGFESASIADSELEAEIKRIVQMVEQYPETGPKVYELVYAEFQEFLAAHLPQRGASQRAMGIAQQVEQKETLLIQYTIELRDMLSDLPVRDQIRDLPNLLTRLRRGMTLLGIESEEQEAHIKAIGDTLADAFLSKTAAIPQEKIDAMAARLANLEDYFTEAGSEGLPLDLESIELMIGADAASIVILTDGDGQPYPASMNWAKTLQLGSWFNIDHNGKLDRVQYVWRSERQQLHLFSTVDGQSYLIQLKRLANYLQTGLMTPQEEEALTVRATRKALAKLDANPERLLN